MIQIISILSILLLVLGCGEPAKSTSCGAGTQLENGLCVATPTECDANSILIDEECVQIDSLCGMEATYDMTTGQCIINDTVSCGEGTQQVMDENGNQVCTPEESNRLSCEENEVFDPETETCVDRDTLCGEGTEFDRTTGLCLATCEEENLCDDGVGAVEPEVLSCEGFNESLTLVNHRDRAIDYIVDCKASVRAPLIIEGGVVINFTGDAGLWINETGSITASSNDCGPVTFEGVDGGAWLGLRIDSSSEDNRLEGVVIRDAGANAFSSDGRKGSIILSGDAQLTLRNSLITGSKAFGIHAVRVGSTMTFEGNTIENSAEAPVLMIPQHASSLDQQSMLANNSKAYVLLEGGELNEDTRWQALTVPYRVKEDAQISVKEDAHLTLEAGAQVQFEALSSLHIVDNASLESAGTAEARVTLSGTESTAGHWRGLYINAQEAQSSLRYSDLLDAGGGAFNSGGDIGAIVLWSSSQLLIEESTVSNSAGHALNAIYPNATLTVRKSTFTDNRDAPFLLAPYLAAGLDADSTYTGNDLDYILVASGPIAGNQSWAPLDVPYRLTSLDDIFFEVIVEEGDSLTLEAGVNVTAEANTGFECYGSFHAAGTAEAKVSFLGTEETAGHWKGLYFKEQMSPSVFTVEHAIIAHAGSSAFTSEGSTAAIVVRQQTEATIADTEFYDNAGECEIKATSTSTTLNLSNNTGAEVCQEN